MGLLNHLHQKLPGRQIRDALKKRAIPPLWMWLRFAFFISIGGFLFSINLDSYGRILLTLSTIQLVSSMLAIVFQEIAKGLERKFQFRKKKNK